jgi:hypothetical protein
MIRKLTEADPFGDRIIQTKGEECRETHAPNAAYRSRG